jgi:hypothetical protein
LQFIVAIFLIALTCAKQCSRPFGVKCYRIHAWARTRCIEGTWSRQSQCALCCNAQTITKVCDSPLTSISEKLLPRYLALCIDGAFMYIRDMPHYVAIAILRACAAHIWVL